MAKLYMYIYMWCVCVCTRGREVINLGPMTCSHRGRKDSDLHLDAKLTVSFVLVSTEVCGYTNLIL